VITRKNYLQCPQYLRVLALTC